MIRDKSQVVENLYFGNGIEAEVLVDFYLTR